MERIAFIVGETFIYHSSIVLTLAAITAICFFSYFYLRKSGNLLGWAAFVPLATAASLYLSRFLHWYCFSDSYSSMEAAMADLTRGGFALLGVFWGSLLVGWALRLTRIVKNLPELLDALVLGGGAGIAVGRLASLFNASDRGMSIEGITRLPLVYPVINPVSGTTEYRLATFMLQAMATGLIFFCLALFYLKGTSKKGRLRDGDTALLFFSAYGAAQIVLDSTRYDSLFMRSNGFISLVQIAGMIAMLVPIMLFSVRMVKMEGLRKYHVLIWTGILVLMGVAAFMEYWVQRHGDQALISYSVMSCCLLVVAVLTVLIRFFTVRREQMNGK